MENQHFQKLAKYSFLADSKAISIFAKLDYFLRNGTHIQREYPNDVNMFRFLSLNENFESLQNYYKDFFNLHLIREGHEFNSYFYLDFNEEGRSAIPSENREYLKSEFIIIGMLFLKMVRLDGNLELESISEFTILLYGEYEEEKNSLRKLIADNISEKGTDYNNLKLNEVIKKAFIKFGELGWIKWSDENEKDKFTMMPSFERLRAAYQPQIDSIDELLKNIKNAT